MVDVAIDQGGIADTSRPTTHLEPTFVVDGILHYCVANMPGAVPATSTRALTNATLPYVRRLAQGIDGALEEDTGLRLGLNVSDGELDLRAGRSRMVRGSGTEVVTVAAALASPKDL